MPGTLGEQTIPGAKLDHSSAPPEPRCAEFYVITQPEGQVIANNNFCLPFVSLQPKLSFQINQCTFWNQSSIFPVFNIWRPGYFGISLPQLGPDPVKLSRKNDFVVTGHENDSEAFKTSNTDTISFSAEGLVAVIDVDPPPWYSCRVCNCHRGYVSLPNGERWNWIEIDSEHYQFDREDDSRNQDAPLRTLIWQFQSSGTASDGLPADMPFAVNGDTRICRVNASPSISDPLVAGNPVAVMNWDGFVFFDGMGPKMAEVQTEDNRALILMSGLAIAQYEGWLAE
ncbi:hypothetical protein N7520_005756 [Penicillium odoratum]|uniref:uncharacterized protein n=1 Tax=Penicillium odoratum TaxID=1167516 RepID=UPI0025471518|nr:uncharacterized protein N7520_005756 [Penicillium odoratum]KAJ5758600.1 hypothetical protein N7520_005756 [Penicillium odoratum]